MVKDLATRGAVTGAVLATAFFASTQASAASQCKGMAESACLGEAQCTWIDGYTRKDGRAVTSHCKSRPAKKAAKVSLAEPTAGKTD